MAIATNELDIQSLADVAVGPTPAYLLHAHTLALATPTQTHVHATLDRASASLISHALETSRITTTATVGNKALLDLMCPGPNHVLVWDIGKQTVDGLFHSVKIIIGEK